MIKELQIHPPLIEKILTGFIQNEVRKTGYEQVVLGLSGGVDSSLCAFLAAKALGPENVTGVIMPYKASSPESARHAGLAPVIPLPSSPKRVTHVRVEGISGLSQFPRNARPTDHRT